MKEVFFNVSDGHRLGSIDPMGQIVRADHSFLQSSVFSIQKQEINEKIMIPISTETYRQLFVHDSIVDSLLFMDEFDLWKTSFSFSFHDFVPTAIENYWNHLLKEIETVNEEEENQESLLENFPSSPFTEIYLENNFRQTLFRNIRNPLLNLDFEPLDIKDPRVEKARELIFRFHNFSVFLLCPEFCDLVLKKRGRFLDKREDVSKAFFLLYLEELHLGSDIDYSWRGIFTQEDFMNFQEKISMDFFPIGKNLKVIGNQHREMKIFKKYQPGFFSLFDYPGSEYSTIDRSINVGMVVNGVTGNLVGSYCFLYHMNNTRDRHNFEDIDIRCERIDGNPVSDEDFDLWVAKFQEQLGVIEDPILTKIDSKKGYKYNIQWGSHVFELFRADFGNVSLFHVPLVRLNFGRNGFSMFPSYLIARLTGLCLDIRGFFSTKKNPYAILYRYINYGYRFLLPEKEYQQAISQFRDFLLQKSYRSVNLIDGQITYRTFKNIEPDMTNRFGNKWLSVKGCLASEKMTPNLSRKILEEIETTLTKNYVNSKVPPILEESDGELSPVLIRVVNSFY